MHATSMPLCRSQEHTLCVFPSNWLSLAGGSYGQQPRILFRQLVILVTLAAVLVLVGQAAFCSPAIAADWPLETLRLKSGIELEGIVLGESSSRLEFAQIVRPPGEAMHAIVRMLPRGDVAQLKRLDKKQRASAVEWFNRFRRQAEFAAAAAESLHLNQIAVENAKGWQYSAPWFDLFSTADERSTRRIIVRLEQLFLAFRQFFPSEPDPTRVPKFLVFASRDEYQDRLRDWGVTVDNPAFYASTQRTVVASCNLGQVDQQTELLHRQADALDQFLKRRNAEFRESLDDLVVALKEQAFSGEEIAVEVRTRRLQWEIEQGEERLRHAEIHRRNERKLLEAEQTFFKRLAHESFHAYFENNICPPDQKNIPRWLNEGLAQVFEAAPIDVDHLRIDAPDPIRLAALQADLRTARPLPLAAVLTAPEPAFLKAHDHEQNSRLYLYSWGITWKLFFTEETIDFPKVLKYLRTVQAGEKPLVHFEQLTSQPIREWETKWRGDWLEGDK